MSNPDIPDDWLPAYKAWMAARWHGESAEEIARLESVLKEIEARTGCMNVEEKPQ